jgi:hypothetical protein
MKQEGADRSAPFFLGCPKNRKNIVITDRYELSSSDLTRQGKTLGKDIL